MAENGNFGTSTSINYSEVQSAVARIKDENLSKMKNIFEDFNSTMQRLGGQDVFVGDASESFQGKYNRLKTKFSEFEKLLLKFASQFESASAQTAQTEREITQAADSINE